MKRAIAIMLIAVLVVMLAGCNYKVVDLTYKFDKAILSLPDGTVVSGKLNNWKDYENCDQVQVVIDGVTYLTHQNNVVLIKEG